MCSGCSKECQAFCHCLRGIRSDRDASLHWTKVTQAAVKLELELQAPSLPHHCKMPSRYFESNAQPEHHSNVEEFYSQIYFETVDSVAICIVEYFNQKDCTMYANTEQVLLKGTWGSQNVDKLCVVRVWPWYPINSALYIGRVLPQFQARWRNWYIA